MIYSTCPITGFELKLKLGQGALWVSTPHPLLQCSLPELNQFEPQGREEQFLAFAAYLVQIGQVVPQAITFSLPLRLANFPQQWLDYNIGKIISFVDWLAINTNSSAAQAFPRYRVSRDTNATTIQEWLENLYLCKQTYTNVLRINSDDKTRRLAAINTGAGIPIATSPAERAATKRQRQNLQSYISKSLHGHGPEKIALVLAVIRDPNRFEAYNLRKVKHYCMDFLDEVSSEDFYQKQDILRKLTEIINKKITLVEALGISRPEARAELQQEFTIIHGNKEYINKIFNLPEASTEEPTAGPGPGHKTITALPQRQDYNSDTAYNLALKVWKRRQVSK